MRSIKTIDPVAEAERIVLDRYAPAWVLVNETLDIVQFRGETGDYLVPASGQPSWNLMRMLREGLSPDVRILIHSVLKEGVPARKESLKVISDAIERVVDVEAVPIATSHILILFMKRMGPLLAPAVTGDAAQRNEITALRSELVRSQKSLQSIIEDQNTINEELQSANEEVLSANEELQSTNEELETAKEELQSTNEELTSLNDELSSRNQDLDHLNNDLVNVLSNANVSIIMVGPDMRIRRFTPMAEKVLKLITTDVGRNLMDINLGFQIENFEKKIGEVVQSMTPLEFETKDQTGNWYSVRIRPYKTTDHRIDGAVIVFINIDDAKAREKSEKEIQNYAEGIIQTVRDPLLVLDANLNVERANQAFYDIFRITAQETVGHPFNEIGQGHWDSSELRELLEKVLPEKREVRDFQVARHFATLGKKSVLLNARTLEWNGQLKHLILISLHDITNSILGRG